MELKQVNGETLKQINHIILELQYAVLKQEVARIEQLRAELSHLEEKMQSVATREQKPPGGLRAAA